jgi:hypothetical protein
VAPSLVTVMSPSGDIKILSSPRGPFERISLLVSTIVGFPSLTRDVRTMLATVRAAIMCDFTASFPYCLFFLPWLQYRQRMRLCGTALKGFQGRSFWRSILSNNYEWSTLLILHHLRCNSDWVSSCHSHRFVYVRYYHWTYQALCAS